MTKPRVVKELGSSKDRGRLRGRKMFNWTVISNVSRGIANTTDLVGTESITMTPKALSQRTSRGGSNRVRVREYSSRGRENVSAIRESNVLGGIPRD